MKRAPIHDHDPVARKGKVLTTTAPILLDELIEEILLRIPARSLLRLRNSVCTSWRTLISSSQFAKGHFRHLMALDVDRALTHTRVAYYGSMSSYPTIGVFSLSSVFENPPHEPTKVVAYDGGRYRKIIGSSNGLLCLHDEERGSGEMRHRAMLWNPCTGLTSSPLESGGAFIVCGFGYDHVNDKYKLYGIVEKKHCESVARIFTFGPNSTWRSMQYFPHRLCDRNRNNRAFLMGYVGLFLTGTATLNWIVCKHFHSNVVWVISLDLVTETYSEFSLPSRDSDDDPRVHPNLGILKGCLAVCYETKKTHWTVWLMKEYGVPQSWTKLAIIPHHPSLVRRPLNTALRLIHMLKNNVLLAIAASGKVVLFNLNDGSIEFPNIDSSGDGLSGYRPLSEHYWSRIFHLYHETLVSPSHFGLPTCSSEMRLFKPSL